MNRLEGRLAFVAALLVAGCGALLGVGTDDEPSGDDPANAAKDGGGDGSILGSDGDVTTNVTDDSGADAGNDAGFSTNPRKRLVFVTERTMNGAFGGIVPAETICKAEALDAGIIGSWVAWLSVTDGGIEPKNRLVTDAGWFLPGDGGQVFTGPSAMTNSSFPQVGIDRTARGVTVTGEAWTGTRPDGTTYQSDCASWSVGTTAGSAVRGIVGSTTSEWTGAAPEYCDQPKRLICFEK